MTKREDAMLMTMYNLVESGQMKLEDVPKLVEHGIPQEVADKFLELYPKGLVMRKALS